MLISSKIYQLSNTLDFTIGHILDATGLGRRSNSDQKKALLILIGTDRRYYILNTAKFLTNESLRNILSGC